MKELDLVQSVKNILEVNKYASKAIEKSNKANWNDMTVKVVGIWDIKRYIVTQDSLQRLTNMIASNGNEYKFEDFIKVICDTLGLSDDYTDGLIINGRYEVEVGGNLAKGLQLILTPVGTNVRLIISEDCPILSQTEVRSKYLTFVEDYMMNDTQKEYEMEYSIWENIPSLVII